MKSGVWQSVGSQSQTQLSDWMTTNLKSDTDWWPWRASSWKVQQASHAGLWTRTGHFSRARGARYSNLWLISDQGAEELVPALNLTARAPSSVLKPACCPRSAHPQGQDWRQEAMLIFPFISSYPKDTIYWLNQWIQFILVCSMLK